MQAYDDIILTLKEKFLLFTLRLKRKARDKYFGKSLYHLIECQLITRNYYPQRSASGANIPDNTYSLTDKYIRYCIYRRHKFFDSKIWPFIISVISSIITAIITAYITTQSIVQ